MPMYEYRCKACGHQFEVIQKFSDAPVRKCPKCGKSVERLVSSSAIQFKGTGWYVTDYGRKGSASESKAEAKDGKGEKEKSVESAKPDKTEKTAKAESAKQDSKPSPSTAGKD